MMVELLSQQSRAGHEAEGLIEIGKNESFGDGVPILDHAPVFETGKRGFARFAGESLAHAKLHQCGRPRVCRARMNWECSWLANNGSRREVPSKCHQVGLRRRPGVGPNAV